MKKNKINKLLRTVFVLVMAVGMLSSFYAPTTVSGAIKAGVTIPANQEFVLGEYAHPSYRSTLSNKSAFNVLVELRDRESNELTRSLELKAGESVKVDVLKNEMVILKNNANTDVLIKVRASRNVAGMRYQELDTFNE